MTSHWRSAIRNRPDFLIRCVYALCLLVATCTHATALIQHGIFWDYGGIGWLSAAFWTSLTVADPVAAVLLFVAPRRGLILTAGIIGLDVLHNTIVFRDDLLHPSALRAWTLLALGFQVAFLLFVIATIRFAWPQVRTDGASPAAAASVSDI
jgi:hypothetical protein